MPFCAPELLTNDNDKLLQEKRIKCFEHGEIWYPKASDLNDPYECSPNIETSIEDIDVIVESLTPEEFLFIEEAGGSLSKENLKYVLKNPNTTKFNTLVKNYLGKGIIPTDYIHRSLFLAVITSLVKFHMGNIGVLSLTENPLDLVMWAHYGNNSKGICIEFERETTNELGGENTNSVTYVETRPTIKFQDRHERLIDIITTKSKIWSYEKEWRNWKKTGGNTYSFPGKIIRIIFGVNCHINTKMILKEIFKDTVRYENIQLSNDFSLRTDHGFEHSLSKVELNWDR